MNWRLTLLSLPLSFAINAAEQGVIQKPELQFYIVPSSTISNMEKASATASDYATPPGGWFINPSNEPTFHYETSTIKKRSSAPTPFVTPVKKTLPCTSETEGKTKTQNEPTFIKVFQK
ncbi:TPA: hypothetical protein RQO57_003560 [Aeromonas dhakensis]|uniref:hypothetical protein n=1 Tax=Aeromonas dhakensis TaxID=196024 RepID=UPI00288F0DA0|nr:hypothetical protein [Aeromonas dhakensis]